MPLTMAVSFWIDHIALRSEGFRTWRLSNHFEADAFVSLKRESDLTSCRISLLWLAHSQWCVYMSPFWEKGESRMTCVARARILAKA